MNSGPRNFIATSAPIVRVPRDTGLVDPSDVTVSYRYQNRTDNPITVSRRDGIRVVVQPTAKMHPVDEFNIYVTYTGSRDVINNAYNLLNESPDDGQENRQLARALRRAVDRAKTGNVSATLEYVLTEEHLKRMGGRVYLTDVDLLIEWPGSKEIEHPFCRQQQEKRNLETLLPNCSDHTFALMFKAVDNSGRSHYADRYINLGGKIYRIPVERDEAYSTGFHVMSRSPVSGHSSVGMPAADMVPQYYTFEQADALFGLQKTVEEAYFGGPVSELRKAQLNDAVTENRLKEAGTRSEQLGVEVELQRLRNEAARNKTLNDSVIDKQKNLLEWAKITTGVIGTVIGALTIWQKFATK